MCRSLVSWCSLQGGMTDHSRSSPTLRGLLGGVMQIVLGGFRGILVGGVIGALAGGLFLVALVFPISLGSPIVPLIGVGGGAIGGVVGGMIGGVTGQKRLTFWGGGSDSSPEWSRAGSSSAAVGSRRLG
jgi:hypothetical protein